MKNHLMYQHITRQRWINGKLYEFNHYSGPGLKTYPAFTEIIVRRWSGYAWELVHKFN